MTGVDYGEEMASRAQLDGLGFPAYGPANWQECGRAIYTLTGNTGGPLFALGLSHQVRVNGRVAFMGVQTFAGVQRERPGPVNVTHAVLTVDGVEHEVVFRGDAGPRPLARFVHNGQTVEGAVENWPMDELRLVTVEPVQYYEDTLLSHWPEPHE
jgi:hypothetical protein